MNHKRCGIGVKTTPLRQNFSVTNPGPAFVFSSSLTSKILADLLKWKSNVDLM